MKVQIPGVESGFHFAVRQPCFLWPVSSPDPGVRDLPGYGLRAAGGRGTLASADGSVRAQIGEGFLILFGLR